MRGQLLVYGLVHIKVSELKEIKFSECINCQKCILSCPKNNTLEFKIKNKSVKPIFILIIVFLIFFGGIGITKVTGLFEVLPPPIISETKINPEEIKGYMTIEEVSVGLKIDINEVYKKLEIPTSIPQNTKLKDIKNIIPNFEV